MNKYLEKLAYSDSIGGYHFKGGLNKKMKRAPVGGAATPDTLKSISQFTKGPVPVQSAELSSPGGSGYYKGKAFTRLTKKELSKI